MFILFFFLFSNITRERYAYERIGRRTDGLAGGCRDGGGWLVADIFCNGIKKRSPSYFFPLSFPFLLSTYGVSFLSYYSFPLLISVTRGVSLGFPFSLLKSVRFRGLLLNSCRGGGGGGIIYSTMLAELYVKYFIHTPGTGNMYSAV